MRRDVAILLATAAVGAAAHWGRAVPAKVAEMETFRIRHVDVTGSRFMSADEVVAQLALTSETSVWTDRAALVERLEAHPLVQAARVRRRVPNRLRVTVTERRPVALAPTPTLEPVDADGRWLPLDPAAHRLDLPIISSPSMPEDGTRVFPDDVRALAAEVDHLMSADTTFLQRVSSVRWSEQGTLIVRWTEPAVDFLLPSRASPTRLREGLGALSDAIGRAPGDAPAEIDLRFADQVVVRRTRDR